MLPRPVLLEHVRRLGREFVRRDMQTHARKLRLYYLALSHDLAGPSHEVDVHWSEPFVQVWLETLRVPPFAQALELKPRGGACNRCLQAGTQPSTRTELVFPGGVRMRCGSCEAVWLELEPTPPPRRADQRTESSSTSKSRVEFGGITGG
jgi:hypothetical protein